MTLVRRLGIEDLSGYRTLRLEGFARHPDQFRYAPEDEAEVPETEVLRRLTEEHVVGVFRADQLVGIGGLTRYRGRKLDHKGLIWGMYVREEARGGGVGSAILTALIAQGRSLGLRLLVLTVAEGNSTARALYHRHGFVVYGVEPMGFRTSRGTVAEALMALELTG